ncbi:MAG: hypothetical protein JO235_24150, partial [Chroococcidiopsidaceae cyanobacterium CP_BM_RX_35]|nr:hypothetical protein [Chroococcidiopsidaceae cyanobacterium CP_BM_RX_35]
QRQAGQFASEDDEKQEQNLLTYGTNNYEEAYTLIQEIDEQLKSHIAAWNGEPNGSKPIPLSLNSYQTKLLRAGIEHRLANFNSAKNDEPQTSTEDKQLLENLIEQLPESSPQEDSE